MRTSRSFARAARAAAAALLACAAATSAASACSICLCGDTSASNLGVSAPSRGEWRLTLENRSLSKSNGLEDDPTGLEFEHENRVSLMAAYAVTDRLSVGTAVPYLDRRITEFPAGERTKTQRISDAEAQARYRLAGAPRDTGPLIATYVLGAITAPTGENDLRDESGERLDEHAQAGTGAWAFNFGVGELVHSHARWLYGSVVYRAQTANQFGYRYGNSLLVTAEAGNRLTDRLSLVAGVAGRTTARDHTGDPDDPLLHDSGGEVLFFTPAVNLSVLPTVLLKAQAYLPLWEDLHGTQDEDANLVFAVTYAR